MTSFFEDLKQGIRAVTDKTEEMTKIGRLKLAVIAGKRDIEKCYIELGSYVYQIQKDKLKVDLSKDEQISTLTQKIKELEKKLHKLNKDIEGIQSRGSTKKE